MRLVLLTLAAAGATIAPPRIHEPFTLLPCPAKPATTLELEGCAEHDLLRGDAAVDARVRVIFRALPSAEGRAAFVQAERAWVAYRRAVCSAEASLYAGGSLEPIAFARCEIERDAAHLRELGDVLKALRHP